MHSPKGSWNSATRPELTDARQRRFCWAIHCDRQFLPTTVRSRSAGESMRTSSTDVQRSSGAERLTTTTPLRAHSVRCRSASTSSFKTPVPACGTAREPSAASANSVVASWSGHQLDASTGGTGASCVLCVRSSRAAVSRQPHQQVSRRRHRKPLQRIRRYHRRACRRLLPHQCHPLFMTRAVREHSTTSRSRHVLQRRGEEAATGADRTVCGSTGVDRRTSNAS